MEKKDSYEAPQTKVSDVELEQGFMNASVYQTKENTEKLDIEDQQVSQHEFDFSQSTQWDSEIH